jgi:succinate dehydrogenase / fumarate reductase cytochrome b subunit
MTGVNGSTGSLRRAASAWLDPRRRGVGGLAFALNRLAGIGLVAYLGLHLLVLSLLARGPEAWDAFLAVASSPAVLVFDVVLIAALLLHGLNGLRLTLLGIGVGVRHQRGLAVGVMVASGALALVAGARILGVV